MKIFIISRVIEERFHTPRLLVKANIPFTLIVDTDDQVKQARSVGCKDILKSPSVSVCEKRNFVISLNTSWFIGLDDNIREFTCVAKKYWNNKSNEVTDTSISWRSVYRTPCSPVNFIAHLEDLAVKCEERSTVYGGVATNENPFFRANKYSYRRFVKSKVFVMRGDGGVHFKYPLAHDSYASALTVAKYGCVVVNNFLHYNARWYEKGGFGNRREREEKGFISQIQNICSDFPGLVAPARGKNSACRFLLSSEKSVDAWRIVHGYKASKGFI